jgi:hypothetical protein
MKLPLNLLQLCPQRDEDGVWFRMSSVLQQLNVDTSNVTFWATDINKHIPNAAPKRIYDSGVTAQKCVFVNLTGLIYFMLRSESKAASTFKAQLACTNPLVDLPLGTAVRYEGRDWYNFPKLVNTVVHSGRVPRQTVTTSINKLPKSETQLLSQVVAGRISSKAWHVTQAGAYYYILQSSAEVANRYKVELAKELSKTMAKDVRYLGAA